MNNKNYNFVSIDVIANKIYKNPLLKDVNFEDIIDLTLSVIKIARVPGVYKEESCYKDIDCHKVALPKNALNIKSVDFCEKQGGRLIPMNMSTGSRMNQYEKMNNKGNSCKDISTPLDYSINGNVMTTSERTGKVFIIFDTVMVDGDDIPMIPDSEALLRAVEAYIKVQVYTTLADLGKISERALNRAEQEYYFNIGKAQAEFQGFGNEDEMDSFINQNTRMFPTNGERYDRYRNMSLKGNTKRL